MRMYRRIRIGAATLFAAVVLHAVTGFAEDAPMATAPIPPPPPKAEAEAPMVAPSTPAIAARPAPPATIPGPTAAEKAPAPSKQKAVAARKAAAKKLAKHHHNPAGQVAKEVAQEARDAEKRERAAARQLPVRRDYASGPPRYPGPPNYGSDMGPPGPYAPPWYGGGGGYAYSPPYPGMRPPPW
jgi:hypothetical protein